jgi:hypothetical protein
VSFAIPNGGTRNKREAKSLKDQGVTSGVPDLMIAYPRNQYPGLFIELKSATGTPTKSQLTMIADLQERGYCCMVCYTLESAMKVVKDYMGDELNARPAATKTTYHPASSERAFSLF